MKVLIKVFLFIICLSSFSCSTPFRPHKEKGWVCRDTMKHSGCKQTNSRYDNIDLHDHDPRELESIEVPEF